MVRGPKRELISRGYNLLLRRVFGARFSDAQCGFKAGRAEIVRALLAAVEDNEWFFDTELLLLAQRNGLRIHEVPVDWVEDTDSQLQQYISQGRLHYVLVGGGGRGGGRGGTAGGTAQVDPWVESNCTAVSPAAYGASATATGTTGGQDLYRCG